MSDVRNLESRTCSANSLTDSHKITRRAYVHYIPRLDKRVSFRRRGIKVKVNVIAHCRLLAIDPAYETCEIELGSFAISFGGILESARHRKRRFFRR